MSTKFHLERLPLALAAVMLVGCSEPEHVSFPTEDGGVIHADMYGNGDHGVVLAHGGQFNKESWVTQAQAFAKAGFRALAIDFRGRGQSKGGPQITSQDDVRFDVHRSGGALDGRDPAIPFRAVDTMTQTMAADSFERFIIRPSVVRVAASGLAMTLVVWVVLALVFGGSSAISRLSALFLILGPIFTAPRLANRGVIEIAYGMVSGPALGGREMIRLEDIDWRRTENRTFLQRVFGGQRIYSTSGRHIIVTPWMYRPEDVWRLSEALRNRQYT